MDMRKVMKVNIAKLLNVRYDKNTGRVILEMEVIDPVWKQRILNKWQELNVKLVIEEEE